jgi:hypothetical protein
MPPESSITEELRRRLLERWSAPADGSDSAVATLVDACDCVSAEFSRWVGVRGYDALISRALAEGRSSHPALGPIHYQFAPEPRVTGAADSIERYGAPATARALETLLESTLALCTRLIGDDIVTTLVERSMENCSRFGVGRGENPDQRSTTP